MTIFLLVLNFSLIIIAFFLIIILFLKFTHIKEMEQKQSKAMKDMEELLGSYLHEMKDENEIFIKNVKSALDSQKQSKKEIHVSEDQLKDDLLEKKSPKIDIKIQEDNPHDLLPNYKKDEPTFQQNDLHVNLLLSKVLQLHNQGYQIEEIAKTLKKGKTEIELLLKFHQTN